MENSEWEWFKISPNKIGIRWKEQPFKIQKSIKWRGIIIHLEINDEKKEYGFITKTTLLIDNQRYSFGMGKHKWMVGSINKPPEVKCLSHKLTFKMEKKALLITEEPLDQKDDAYQDFDSLFEIMNTPDNVVF